MHEKFVNSHVLYRIRRRKSNGRRIIGLAAAAAVEITLALCRPGAAYAAWETGDVVQRELDGETYDFRCIDEDYIDVQGSGKTLALFLCDRIVPASHGSSYKPEPGENGIYDYAFTAGPIVNFGTGNDYKYSAVRAWIKKSEQAFEDACFVNVGSSWAYTGSTETDMFSQLNRWEMVPHDIGYQQIYDRLFLLSVDEALEYRDWLWKFEGSALDNPESQTGMFCKGYWLRTPFGFERDEDSGMVYIVDLINGNIRPERVAPQGNLEDEELDVTGTTGVRPAFVLEQRMGNEEEGL